MAYTYRDWSAALGELRLLHHLSRIFQIRLEDERKGKLSITDRKLRRKVEEKMELHGLKRGG